MDFPSGRGRMDFRSGRGIRWEICGENVKKMSDPIRPIQPELLAAKLEQIRNFQHPRLLEEFGENPKLAHALWFLQWVSHPSNFPGGLSRFAADFISEYAEEIGTRHMREFGKVSRYTFEQANAILGDLPKCQKETLVGGSDPDDDLSWLFFDGISLTRAAERDKALRDYRKNIEKVLRRLTRSFIHEFCVNEAKENLADYFKQLCETPHVGLLPCDRNEGAGAPWYFEKVAKALLAFIEARADRTRSGLAETEVVKVIRRELAKARRMQKSFMVTGNSRFAKSETVKTEAIADPGRYRLVETPRGNAISDLVREVAKSYGLEFELRTTVRELYERIDYVRRFSNLQLIFDEAQFLLPANYSRNTEPARLNWIRRSFMDQGSLVIFVCTPQSYETATERFVKKTGFSIDQFHGRFYEIKLPAELGEDDLRAVSRFHSGDLDEAYVQKVVGTVLTHKGNLSDVEKIVSRAKDNALEHGRRQPNRADINAAIGVVFPNVEPALPAQKAQPKPSIQRPCKRAAEALPMPRRGGLETTLSRDRLERPAEVPVPD
jgi:hypothetical protein